MGSLASAREIAQEAICTHGATQKLEELCSLVRALQRWSSSIYRVLEIGTQEGGTLWTWMQLATDHASIVSLDLDQSRNEQTRGRAHQRLFPIEGDSHDPSVQAQVQDRLIAPVDLLFIDGDHTYEGVKDDFFSYSPLVRPGGVIVLHDIAPSFHPDCQVDRLWTEIKALDLERFRPDVLEFIDPSAVNLRNGAVLPAASCGIGILFC